ncbi:nuclear transport factor 2 family protein [Enterococcus sp. AZ109]|uniref:nuclear transport factor 2 family protein n=1 Tax=Enterococcus sp. AZ109 TaxID=2774634 RepID=UPI003F26A819
MEEELRKLIEEDKIRKLQYRYARGVDMHDYELLRSCFADTIEVDFTDYLPEAKYNNLPAEKWVEMVRQLTETMDATQHTMTNIDAEFNGDTAKAVVYLRAMHYLPNNRGENHAECGGYYENTYEKIAGEWKIKSMKLTYSFWLGNQYVATISSQK